MRECAKAAPAAGQVAFALSRFSARHSGFTLVEMLVSLAIFTVITGFAIANFRRGGQGDELRLASQGVADTIRRAQTSALAGATVYACTNAERVCDPAVSGVCAGGSCERKVPKGFGLRFSAQAGETHIAIFYADLNGNRLYDDGETIQNVSVSASPNVNVTAVAPAAGSLLDIVFEPPKPKTYFNGNAADSTAQITLQQSGTGLLKSVTVNRISGQVSGD